ncbi:MAG: EAL domain-containing protein [Gammaproteobacteria bacterium]
MSDSAGFSVLIVTAKEDEVSAINRSLREAGLAAHCTRIEKLANLEEEIISKSPELLLVIDNLPGPVLAEASSLRRKADPNLPLLLVSEQINETTILDAMRLGARDVISLQNTERLRVVAERELHTYRLEKALEHVMGSAKQYKQELHSLKEVTLEAIADVQEGIIVHANPSWLELFDYPADTDLIGMPIMDLCSETDRPTLKGALVACERGKWSDSKLEISGLNPEKNKFSVSFNLEKIEHDGETAIRIIIVPEQTEDDTPQLLIEQALQRDQATGFFNRNHFINTARTRLSKPPAGGVRAIAYIRPDRFAKAVEDIGLIGTEAIIIQFSQILRQFVQPNDIYARFGGTMFVLLLERGTMADAEAWSEQLQETINEAVFEHDDHSTVITCTIGLSEIDSAKDDLSDLLSETERSCKKGRIEGGNRIELCESSGAAKKIRQDDTIWIPKIRGALAENRMRLEHQPIGSLNEDIGRSYDTLVRMLDEEGNTILPGEFMPAAERTGLSKNIDRWVIAASVAFCATNKAELVFIRLSKESLLDESLSDWVNKQIKQVGTQPMKLCFETDEAIVAKHMKQTQNTAKSLRELGCKFAVEHFGKLENSQRLLKYIPMEFVKIDGSLMQGLHKSPAVQNQVKELARQAREKKIQTIAERVQDANTMAVLWQLGISYIQGNYVQAQEIVMEDQTSSGLTTQALQLEEEHTSAVDSEATA